MNIVPTELPGVLLIRPQVFRDDRGSFLESFNAPRFAAHGLPAYFAQDNHAHSRKGVLRGLHYQLHHPQGKLVTCVRGEIYDVAVDVRRGSPCFGAWTGVALREEEPEYLWIPPGFAHGYCVLSDVADVVYKCTEVYHPEDDHGVPWDDPTLGIAWPIETPIISAKDTQYSAFSASRLDLPVHMP